MKKHEKRNRLFYVFVFLILAAGTGFLAYPTVSDWYCRYAARAEIVKYDQQVAEEDAKSLEIMRQEAVRYNARYVSDAGQELSAVSYNDLLSVTDAIGYLEIPKISVYLPVYHGVEDTVLEKGIGHLPESSLPVGGASTHSVLSGHSGLPAAKILTELDQMEEGDRFYLHVLDETLAYEVDQIKIVLPTESEDIQIVEGKDYVTILTCVPYGINTHRLLVRGVRTEDTLEAISVQAPAKSIPEPVIEPELLKKCLIAAAAVFVFAIMGLILFVPTGKRMMKERVSSSEQENI